MLWKASRLTRVTSTASGPWPSSSSLRAAPTALQSPANPPPRTRTRLAFMGHLGVGPAAGPGAAPAGPRLLGRDGLAHDVHRLDRLVDPRAIPHAWSRQR